MSTTTNQTHFSTAFIDAEYVLMMTLQGEASDLKTPAREVCRYTAIADHLVPETFIQRVKSELDGIQYEFGFVLSKKDMFTSEFLDSLDDQEHTVVMPVVLLLIARNEFGLNLWADKGLKCINAKEAA